MKNNSCIVITDSAEYSFVMSLINESEISILNIISTYVTNEANISTYSVSNIMQKSIFSSIWDKLFPSKRTRKDLMMDKINSLCNCAQLDGLIQINLCAESKNSIKYRLIQLYDMGGILAALMAINLNPEFYNPLDVIDWEKKRLQWPQTGALKNITDETKNAINTIIQLEREVYSIQNPCENDQFSSNNPNANVVLDPSGFVYEAVPSNRLSGVTVGVYHKIYEEDMYGNITEKVVLWDAADYGQANPQITNEYGEYAWDVPQGQWQVKYEKEGYQTVYSDWLPVPPPQLDINVAMVQAAPPHVWKVQGYESGIEITFDKFMLPATMTTELITVTRNETNVAGIITLLDAETNPTNSSERFVSKVRFVPETPFATTDNVILTVKRTVKSYTGNTMDNDFIQRIEIQKEVNSITAPPVLEMSLHETGFIEVTVAPKEAAAGKKITARSVSSTLATVTGNTTLDANGKAKLQVGAEMPGSTQIVVAVDGTDMKTIVEVHIAMPVVMEKVEKPVASIPSGSTVAKNTAVTLSSTTAGAAIHYTTDGSLPSQSTGLEYIQPVVITEDVTIKAIATKESMTDSEIAVFEYRVDNETGIIQSPQKTFTIYVRNQTLFIKGLAPGEQYTVYSVLGNAIIQGSAVDKQEQQIALPSKGVFIVSTSGTKTKVLVE